MKSNDIVLQVSEETAEVMNNITETLFEDTENRFDEVVEAIGKSIDKIEEIYSRFAGYADDKFAGYTEKADSNKTEILIEIEVVKEILDDFKKNSEEKLGENETKSNRLIEIVTDISQLIQMVSKEFSESYKNTKEYEASLQKTVKELSENLTEIQKQQTNIINEIRADDNGEKMTTLANKLTEIEREIFSTKDTANSIAEALRNCDPVIENILISVGSLLKHDKDQFERREEELQKIDALCKQEEGSAKIMLEKIGDALTCLNTLSSSIQEITEKQMQLCEKQDKLEKDVKYLKLPFFKRWFTKG